MNVQPKDPRIKHFYVSMAKSVIRMIAGAAFITGLLVTGGLLIIIAEILGIVEEIV